MTHTFKRGVVWQAGASGNFLCSQFVPPEQVMYFEEGNEYKVKNDFKYFLNISKEITPQMETLACHPFPTKWIQDNDIYIDDLIMIKPDWFSELLLYAKRMMQFRSSPNDLVWMIKQSYKLSHNKELDWHNFKDVQALIKITDRIKQEFGLNTGDIQRQSTLCVLYMVWLKSNKLSDDNDNIKVFVQQEIIDPCMKAVKNNTHLNTEPYDNAVIELEATGKIGKVHNIDYEDLFINCNSIIGIDVNNIKDYSTKNVDLLTTICKIADRNDLLARLDSYREKLNKATNE